MRISAKMSCVAFVITFAGTTVPAFAENDYYEPAPGGVYVDPMPMGSVYVEPVPIYDAYGYDRSPALTLGDERERYTNEYMGGGGGDYYQGITHPAPVP
ncbi:hypothetical protein BLJAPNOD_02971 [Ensifer sp. M14]|uniref:hypothetical protein n=1 Tax=Sinorhizobium/Ensifer group TaxID=227292 RepID=UPI000986B1EB|nr:MULTISPECIES: hypothetical protein [Sinorhizobium/Ensifer group]OOG75594.1 hypothetical protein B0E45_01300 [Sinorhizobium sp. A49]RDL51827.1 hypothetical protein BLJAPNOD_02971 [Ensifer sp. M14]